jgi:regulator of sigma E protease
MLQTVLTFTNIERFFIYAVTLSLLVLVHEWGHFIVARRSGVGVREFALGFGPAIWSWDSPKTGTRYRLNSVPLGGYCAMIGEDNKTESDGREVSGTSYAAVSAWSRLAIVAAGPIVNIFVAFMILWITAASIGVPGDHYSTQVGPVTAGDPADKAGLHPGDTIVSIDGIAIKTGTQMIDYIHSKVAKPLVISYSRLGSVATVHLTTIAKKIEGKTIGLIGFKPLAVYDRQSPLAAASFAGGMVWRITCSTFDEFRQLLRGTPDAVNGISGPIGMARVAVAVQDYGPQLFLSFTALLSLSLGIFNLLPIPALDGGRALFVIAELLRGKPVDPDKEAMVHITGFAALILLVLFVTYHDILHIASGQAAF